MNGAGGSKLQVVKTVKELTGLGLKEAKAIVDGAPGPVKEALPKADAEAMLAQLQEAGADVELK
jgi:large subunit ribosomal protein L7/L12